jgi:tRNA(Ile)-lysidine synthase
MEQRTTNRKGRGLSRFAFRLWQEWKRLSLPLEGARVVIAVSGGADSVALLLALRELVREGKLSLSLIVAHFNHGLREEAKEDATWIERLAKQLELEFVLDQGDVRGRAEKNKDNLEQAARRSRYEFLQDVALKKETSIIVTAHTMDDQAETVLLRLMRGSGAEGLGGIEPVRLLKGESEVLLVRPLLGWTRRADTEDYCRELGIDFRLDAMNDDARFARVRVRKELLRLMQTFNEQVVETLARTAAVLREDAAELRASAEILLVEASDEKEPFSTVAPLSIEVLSNASSSLRRRALRLWLERGRGDLRRLGMVHIQQIESLLIGQQGGRVVVLPGGQTVERRKRKLLFHVSRKSEI